MKPATKYLLIGGAAAVVGGIIYALRKSTVSPELLDEVAATASGPDYDTVLTYGGWKIDRERQYSFPKLKPGAIAYLSMYPAATGYSGPHYEHAAQIIKATPAGSFTIYEARWATAPGGLDLNSTISFTSADIARV